MKRFYLLFLSGLCLYCSTKAQQVNIRNTEWMNYLEEMSEQEDVDESSIELLYEELSALSENPLNINTLGKEDLQRFPFLSDKEIEDILYYVYKYGPIQELSELKNAEKLDWQSLIYLLPFLYAGEVEKKNHFCWKDLARQGKQEVLIRSDYTLQEKAGYRSNNYQGEPYYLSIRYGYKFRDKIQFGIAMEKDAGETLWKREPKGFDHYAININIKDVGILRNLHVGDYRLAFGEGLSVNTQFSMGKSADVTNLGLRNTGISRHASPNENNYFRGLAAEFRLSNMYLNFFASYRHHDANTDSLLIYTFKTDGYNRTEKELEKRRTALVQTVGGNIQCRSENMIIGLTTIAYSFGGKELSPNPQPYNLYYLRGKGHANLGVHYQYWANYFIFRGETAVDKNGKCATLNHLIFQPNSRVNFSLSLRNYSKNYNAFFGKAFGEASLVQNESGIYAGINLKPFSRWEVTSYFDSFRFPWLRFGINTPSSGKDFLLGITYRPRSSSYFYFRYKHKEKAKNQTLDDERETLALPYRQHRFRQQFQASIGNKLSTRLQMDYSIYKEANKTSVGWAISKNFGVILKEERLRWDMGLAYFRANDWTTRISAYEKNILYAFGFSSFYGKGMRFYSVCKWKAHKSLTCYLKLGHTHYFDRVKIGTGLDEIEGSNKSDLSALVKVSF